MNKLTYLASPYTSDDPAVMEERYQLACKAVSVLKNKGWLIYSPITHSHGPAQYGLPKDYAYWKRYCEVMLPKCDDMMVLQIDGWENSKGVKAEIDLADKLGIPVRTCDFETLPFIEDRLPAQSAYPGGVLNFQSVITMENNTIQGQETGLGRQEGGSHYQDFDIQPIEFITRNKIGFIEGNIIKYACRHDKKDGAKDVRKIIHYAECLLDLNYKEQ